MQGVLLESAGRLRLRLADLAPSWESDLDLLYAYQSDPALSEAERATRLSTLLGGGYLAGLHADWTQSYRRYWEREAIHVLDAVATACEQAGYIGPALTCLERELEFCPDDAPLVRRVMMLYHALGGPGKVRSTFASHRRILRDDLDVVPEQATIDLYDALMPETRVQESTAHDVVRRPSDARRR